MWFDTNDCPTHIKVLICLELFLDLILWPGGQSFYHGGVTDCIKNS